jgi:hypothetical protein
MLLYLDLMQYEVFAIPLQVVCLLFVNNLLNQHQDYQSAVIASGLSKADFDSSKKRKPSSGNTSLSRNGKNANRHQPISGQKKLRSESVLTTMNSIQSWMLPLPKLMARIIFRYSFLSCSNSYHINV